MKDLLEEILKFEGVRDAFVFDARGGILYRDAAGDRLEGPQAEPWWPSFIESLRGMRGFELVYSGGGAYVRTVGDGYLLVLTDGTASMAMIRLNCDVLLHERLQRAEKQKPRGFFRRRR